MLLFATIVAALVVACIAVLGSVGAAVCGPSWSTVPSAPEFGVPRAIAAIAQDDVWIVGWKMRGNEGITTGAEHWDGASWTLFPTPNGSTGNSAENSLNGADALEQQQRLGGRLLQGCWDALQDARGALEWRPVERRLKLRT